MLSRLKVAIGIVTVLAAIAILPVTSTLAISWTGYPASTVRAKAGGLDTEWSQWAFIYYQNNGSTTVDLQQTSHYIKLHDHEDSLYSFLLVNTVEGASTEDEDISLSNYYLPIGGQYNWRHYYNSGNPSAGKTFNKNTSGQNTFWVDVNSYDGTSHGPRLINHHVTFTSSVSHCVSTGVLTVISGGPIC